MRYLQVLLIGLIALMMAILVIACDQARAPYDAFQPHARPTASNATVFNAISTDQADVTTLNATTANMTTADIGTLNASTFDVTSAFNVQTINVATATITNALILGGAQFSGAIRFGTVQTQTNGAEVTHGFNVTPTTCIVSMKYTGTDIISATVAYISQTVFVANVSEPGTMYWMCGR